jgi:hypothetical protein
MLSRMQVREDLHERLKSGERLRRKLHNQLQDIKGNVRVMVSVQVAWY